MPMSCIDKDLEASFSDSDFGVEGGAFLNGDTSNPIKGIFDDEDVETVNGEGQTVLVRQTTFTCASSQVPDLADNDTLNVDATAYTVRFWQSDGAGMTTIFLERS